MTATEVIAEALAKHLMYEDGSCSGCQFHVDNGLFDTWEVQFSRHQAAVIAALPDIAIVPVTPGTCVDDPRGTHRWMSTNYPWQWCPDCRLRKHDALTAGGES